MPDGPHPASTCPTTARRGEVIEIRTLIAHPMETGFRPGADGKVLPRDIIRRFTCRYNGEPVFSAELFSGDRGQPLSRLPHRRHRERHAGVRAGRATTASRRPRRVAITRRHDGDARGSLAALPCWPLLLGCAQRQRRRRRPAPLRLRVHERRRRRRCSATTPPTRHAVGARTARRCGTGRPARSGKSCAELPRRRAAAACAASRRATRPSTTRSARPVNLGQRINLCRQRHQQAAAAGAPRAQELLGLEAYVAHAVARHADRAARRPAAARRSASAASSAVRAAHRPARPVVRAVPRRARRRAARRQPDPAGASDRLSDLPARVAGPGLAAAAPAQLHDRRARRALCARSVELVELELYLAPRAKGMPLETPGVRP